MNLRETVLTLKGCPTEAVTARAKEAADAHGALTQEQEASFKEWAAKQLQYRMGGYSKKKW